MSAKKKETISIQDGSVIIPIAFAVARYGGKITSADGERGGGITRTELAIVDAILHKIQALVCKRIDMKAKGDAEDSQLMLRFEEEAGKITDSSQSKVTDVGGYEFRFPLRDLGIAPRHYQEAFDTLMKMGDINVEWEFDDEKNGRSTTKKQLFQPTAFGAVKRWNDPDSHRNAKGQLESVPPNTPNHLFHWEYTGKPAVGISMSGIVADRLFDPYRYGHYLDVTLDFKCKYSIRLYWFLSLYWSRGFTRFDFSWYALRTTLGIDQNPEGGKNVIQEIPERHLVLVNAPDSEHIISGVYPKLSLFTKRVLEPIEEDFKRMAPVEASDAPPRVEYNLKFDVVKKELLFNNTRKEMPDRIIITLNVSSLGRQIQEGRDINAQQRRIINKMTDQLFLQQDKALYFTRTAAGLLQQLEEKVDYLISGIAERNPQWSICETLEQLDTSRDADLQAATTENRRKNIEKRHVSATRSAIQGYAMRSLSDFCEKELTNITPSEGISIVSETENGEMKLWDN